MSTNSVEATRLDFVIERDEIAVRVIEKMSTKIEPELSKAIMDVFSMGFTFGAGNAASRIQKKLAIEDTSNEVRKIMLAICLEVNHVMEKAKK